MKLVDAIKGLFLTASCVRIFDPVKQFKEKKIAIVGPADSAFEVANGSFIDSVDYVIRINKAIHSWSDENSKYIGRRTDILFHSFFENNESGGGPLTIPLFREAGLKYLVNPRTNFAAYRRTFNFFRKYKIGTVVYHLPASFYKKMLRPFGQYRPTIGYTALYSALNSSAHMVYITGFTFFKTPYADGYRDHLQNVEKNLDHINTHDIHDVNLEFDLFKRNLEDSNVRNVILDEKLDKILKATENE